jgi:hypothetical protein
MAKKIEQTPDTTPVVSAPLDPATIRIPPLSSATLRAPSPAVTVPPEIQGTPVGEVYEVLANQVGEYGLVDLSVIISHDNLLAGQTIFMPLTVRVAGLVERGFLEVVPEGWN